MGEGRGGARSRVAGWALEARDGGGARVGGATAAQPAAPRSPCSLPSILTPPHHHHQAPMTSTFSSPAAARPASPRSRRPARARPPRPRAARRRERAPRRATPSSSRGPPTPAGGDARRPRFCTSTRALPACPPTRRRARFPPPSPPLPAARACPNTMPATACPPPQLPQARPPRPPLPSHGPAPRPFPAPAHATRPSPGVSKPCVHRRLYCGPRRLDGPTPRSLPPLQPSPPAPARRGAGWGAQRGGGNVNPLLPRCTAGATRYSPSTTGAVSSKSKQFTRGNG
jgi:hypothetical protein